MTYVRRIWLALYDTFTAFEGYRVWPPRIHGKSRRTYRVEAGKTYRIEGTVKP
jgi:hypothetical protein